MENSSIADASLAIIHAIVGDACCVLTARGCAGLWCADARNQRFDTRGLTASWTMMPMALSMSQAMPIHLALRRTKWAHHPTIRRGHIPRACDIEGADHAVHAPANAAK